jgi:transposase
VGEERRFKKKIPEVIARIEDLMKYETAGDPMSGLKWTRKTTEKIAAELASVDINVGKTTVGKILKKLGFSLKSNSKKISNGGKSVTKAEQSRKYGINSSDI